jgi:hypothetical protein
VFLVRYQQIMVMPAVCLDGIYSANRSEERTPEKKGIDYTTRVQERQAEQTTTPHACKSVKRSKGVKLNAAHRKRAPYKHPNG